MQRSRQQMWTFRQGLHSDDLFAWQKIESVMSPMIWAFVCRLCKQAALIFYAYHSCMVHVQLYVLCTKRRWSRVLQQRLSIILAGLCRKGKHFTLQWRQVHAWAGLENKCSCRITHRFIHGFTLGHSYDVNCYPTQRHKSGWVLKHNCLVKFEGKQNHICSWSCGWGSQRRKPWNAASHGAHTHHGHDSWDLKPKF